jgi:hypothetical protein
LGSTTVSIRGNQPACNQGDQLIHRCFDISPTSANAATVRFWYLNSEKGSQDPTQMKAYHWNGSVWNALTLAVPPRGIVDSYEWVESVNVNTFSPFGLSDGSPATPTTISLSRLNAHTASRLPVALTLAGLVVLCGALILRRKRQ